MLPRASEVDLITESYNRARYAPRGCAPQTAAWRRLLWLGCVPSGEKALGVNCCLLGQVLHGTVALPGQLCAGHTGPAAETVEHLPLRIFCWEEGRLVICSDPPG